MPRKVYVHGPVEVSFDASLCVHAGECVRGLPAVFDPQARPWIRPAAATPAELESVVARCPTGALRFRRLDAPGGPAAEASPAASAAGRVVVTVQPDGPLLVAGPVALHDASGRLLREADRVALCRCGASASKPYCDGAHARAGFRAP